MGTILCPTRGGQASSCSHDEAIAIAKERGDDLLFLYVVNLHFLDKTAAPIVVDVVDELQQMGEFMLLMAKERAENQGVSTRILSRKGEVREEIKKVAQEEDVSLVLLGRPAGEQSSFQLAELEEFAAEIEAETGIEAQLC
jgi:nucleotide-binding universal stress UspA family protein